MQSRMFAAYAIVLILLTAAGAGPRHASAMDGVDGTRLVGTNGLEFAHVMDMFMTGDYAYASIGLGQGFQAYDISDPAHPARVSSAGASAWRSWARGDTAYSFAHESGVELYDISGGPGVFLDSYNPPDPLVHYEGGVAVGGSLYVAAHQQGIHVIDLTAASISAKFPITLSNNAAWNITESGGYLFVANGRHGLAVVDLALPASEVAALALPGLANDIVISGDHAFLSLAGDGVASVNISDPLNPVLADLAPTEGNAFGIGLVGDILAVGSYAYLERFDVSDPNSIILAGWDATTTYTPGADAGILTSGDTVIAVADWRGMSVYTPEPDTKGDIEAYPLRLDFGAVADGAPEDTVVHVRNAGAGSLHVTSVIQPSGIAVTPESFDLGPGETMPVLVTATGAATTWDRLRYVSDDPDQPVFNTYVYKNNIGFPQVGSAAPGFNLFGTDGEWHDLSDYLGKVVYLEFGASW